jgi:hypothetical protein
LSIRANADVSIWGAEGPPAVDALVTKRRAGARGTAYESQRRNAVLEATTTPILRSDSHFRAACAKFSTIELAAPSAQGVARQIEAKSSNAALTGEQENRLFGLSEVMEDNPVVAIESVNPRADADKKPPQETKVAARASAARVLRSD